ncbi:MAG: cell filamentation protein Fic [Deltaproteobacteria bacterium]|nr:MAG: cell filamentation protein Fic [Deltaproteobacteria bacterium]
MNFKDFKAGHWVQQYQYQSFSPGFVNHDWTWDDPRISTLLEHATRAIGELNAFSLIVPDVDLFIRMHVLKEANTSSRIEGTQTEIDEALKPKELVDPERRDDWQEVQNYIKAMSGAIEDLESLPLSNRLLRNTHEILLEGVRGEGKLPGEFRKSQNWIGGSGPSDAAFVPPHHTELPELMSDLEKFLHNDALLIPDLVRISIAHYQFETIHPFLDGNGRIGRLLITLYLVSKGLLKKPTLYLSAHIEKHKGDYYHALTRARESDDMGYWVRFLLTAIRDTGNKGAATFQSILELRKEVERTTLSLGKKAENARLLLNHLYRKPLVTANEVAELLNVTHQTASSLIRDFENLQILKKWEKIGRSQLYIFGRYFALFLD